MKFIKNYIGFYIRKYRRGKQSRIVMKNGLMTLLKKHKITKEQLFTLPIDAIRLKDNKISLPITKIQKILIKEEY